MSFVLKAVAEDDDSDWDMSEDDFGDAENEGDLEGLRDSTHANPLDKVQEIFDDETDFCNNISHSVTYSESPILDVIPTPDVTRSRCHRSRCYRS